MKKTQQHIPCRSVLAGSSWPGGLLKPFVTSVGLYLEHFCGQGLGFHLCGFGLFCSGLCFALHQEQQNIVPTSVGHAICEILHNPIRRDLKCVHLVSPALPQSGPNDILFAHYSHQSAPAIQVILPLNSFENQLPNGHSSANTDVFPGADDSPWSDSELERSLRSERGHMLRH